LAPGCQFILNGNDIEWVPVLDEQGNPTGEYTTPNIQWLDNSIPFPTKEEYETESARLIAEWESLEYQRQRQPEYPPLADLADALYWQSQGDESKMTAYLAAVDAVKEKYPKG
jgi:hypothetical protein